ncbi:MAG TPA: molybdenum ABC transporter ATP-binding protein [Pirellulales bacterium]|nr:molybdenum ABC transporter ATP-binding protein [Pirellulales bacterium]
MNPLLVADFEKRFAAGPAIHGRLQIPAAGAGITVLFGPSGCGKTTILRALAGLERPDAGRIEFAGELWFDAATGVSLSPQRRGVGFLFQHYALFPHLTVGQNVAYGLDRRTDADTEAHVDAILARLQIAELAARYPAQLSGGQQQRVALARALACRPRLLLLDEPLSALDAPVREQLRGELRRLLLELARPTIMVTHDRVEALALADTVVVITEGQVRQTGPVHEVFSRPADRAIARVVGIETVVPGTIESEDAGLVTVKVADVTLTALATAGMGRNVFVCLRGEDVLVQKEAAAGTSARNRLPARVTSRIAEGPMVRVGLDCGFSLTALITRPACDELNLQVGDRVVALIKAPAIHLVGHA